MKRIQAVFLRKWDNCYTCLGCTHLWN